MTVRLTNGADSVEIDPDRGGRISSLVISGRERLVREPCSELVEPALAWGCYLMVPFVGRVFEGRVQWDGQSAQLRQNHGRHAIHGVAFDVPWTVTDRSDGHVALACRLDPSRWPFGGEVRQQIALDAGRLVLEAEILAERPTPAALGWHPWFVREPGGMRVSVTSDRVLDTGPDLIPTGGLTPVDAARDLRAGRAVDDLDLDDVYTSAKSPAALCWSDLELRMSFARPIETVVVYTHPAAVCLEPQTAWPDAIRLAREGCTDTGLAHLEAGQRLVAATTWGWRTR
jgi:galactose mutarotase-like enzyme